MNSKAKRILQMCNVPTKPKKIPKLSDISNSILVNGNTTISSELVRMRPLLAGEWES